jgi:STAS domain-containing protein
MSQEDTFVGLQVSIRQSADVTILDLQGRATIGRGNDLLRSHLRKVIGDGTRKVLLNLAGVTQVDSSSLSTYRPGVCFRYAPRRQPKITQAAW